MNELDERKVTILKAIIKNYLETGEPVGSRTISKLSGINLSSATIRNEMSDLKELGYIIQPHTSAGRIPSDKGYRFYVDSIMSESEKTVTEVTDLMIQRVDKLEMLLQRLVKLLAVDTNYAALISGPTSENKIKYIQLSAPELRKLLLILVLDGNTIKNEVFNLDEDMTQQTALDLTIMLNNQLSGLSLKEITKDMIDDLLKKAGNHKNIVAEVLKSVIELMESGNENPNIFTAGARNIFKYPELSEVEKAEEIITAFEEKERLQDMVNEVSSLSTLNPGQTGIKVYIGGEGPVKNMKDCSFITANYELGDGMQGVIGVIGPKRMDYEKVVSTMQNLKEQLDKAFKENK